jgi:putative transposase
VVESDAYLLGLIRYVHKNPEKANLAKWDQYIFSSGSHFKKLEKSELVENTEIYRMFYKNVEEGLSAYKEFMKADQDGKYLDIDDDKEVDETNCEEYILKYYENKNRNRTSQTITKS